MSLHKDGPLAEAAGVLSNLEHLDFCMQLGEEPWEIETMVLDLSKRSAAGLKEWLGSKGVAIPVEVVEPFLASFLINTYLVNWAPRETIGKLNRPKLSEFFEPFAGHPFLDPKVYLSPFELLSLYFRYLEDIGYELPLERLMRAIETVELEIRKAAGVKHPGTRRLKFDGDRGEKRKPSIRTAV